MAYQSGTREMGERTRLRLVDADGSDVWDPAVDTEDAETLEELADLFIGEQGVYRGTGAAQPEDRRDRAVDTPEETDSAVTIEAVITGHLPVRGSLWVRAYAARVSAARGEPVALVRVTPERTSVALVGSSAEADPVDDIATAVRAAGVAAGHWVLHFDELDQAGLLHAGRIDRVTVLSGADEPAIVSAYRLIKSIAEETGEGDETAGRIGVAIVGADAANTARATTRLVDATRQFLGVTLDDRPGVPRVRSASVALLGDSDRRHEPADVIAMIVEPRGGAAGTEPVDSHAADTRGEETAGDIEDRPSAALMVEGLTATGLPCPIAPGVELATDGAGLLHLLCWWRPEAPGELLRAGAWARVNMPLLEKVCPPLRGGSAAPTLHIVCDDPAIAAEMRGMGTVVHLALPASRAAEGWVSARVC